MMNDNVPQEALDYFLNRNLIEEANKIWDLGNNKGFGTAQQYWTDYVTKNKDKMLAELMSDYQSTLKDYSPSKSLRTYYGTPEMWEGELRPDATRYNTPGLKNNSLNRFSTTADLNTAKGYMKGNPLGDVYAFDINPDNFYYEGLPFKQQSLKVQKAILTDVLSNPNSAFSPSGTLRNLEFAKDFEGGQALSKYGILGERYDGGAFTFADPSQVPTGRTTMQGALASEVNLPNIGKVPTKAPTTPVAIKQSSINNMLREMAIERNLYSPTNFGSHGSGALFFRYDPAFAYTGEGAQVYSKGMYTGSTTDIGDYYRRLAERQGKKGYLYKVDLPDQYKYYNTDLPSTQQSLWVKERLGEHLYPKVDKQSFTEGLYKTGRFNTLYDDFYKATGRAPASTGELISFVNKNITNYPRELFPPLKAMDRRFDELDEILRNTGVVGTTHYKPHGAHVNITYNPDDINIYGFNEVGDRQYAKAADVDKTFNELLKGYRRAFNPINRTILQNPYTKAALRALGTTASVAGGIGDAITIYDVSNRIMNKYADWYDEQPELYKKLNQHNLIIPGNFAPKYSVPKLEKQSSDFANNLLPFIQLNEDGSMNNPLQGQVNYDYYILEPLGDNIYMRTMLEGEI